MSQQTANPARSIVPARRSGAIRTRFAHAMEALLAIAAPTAIIVAAILLILAAADLRPPSVQFTGASLTVRFDPPPGSGQNHQMRTNALLASVSSSVPGAALATHLHR